MFKRRPNNRGITLLENLVSVFIISLSLLAIIKVYFFANYQINMSRHRVTAVNLAQATLENIIDAGYDSVIVGNYPISQAVVIDPGKTDAAGDDINGTMQTVLTNFNFDQGYKFTVTMAWNEPIGNDQRALTEAVGTLLTPYE